MVRLYRIEKAGGEVGFLWVPAHVGVEGNEMADKVAKRSLRKEVDIDLAIGAYECRSIIKRKITSEWQKQWEREKKGRHYFSIQGSVNKGPQYVGAERRQAVTMTRLRLGHCGLAWDLAKMGKHPDGLCDTCHEEQTVKHVLMECTRFAEERKTMFAAVASEPAREITLKGLLNPTENQPRAVKAVLEFIAATGLGI